MLAAIDAAYPFGMRQYTPYKEWLQERAKAMSELTTDPNFRPCPVCGAGIGRSCREIVADGTREGSGRAKPRRELETFHEARAPQLALAGVDVVPRGNGPLFERNEPRGVPDEDGAYGDIED